MQVYGLKSLSSLMVSPSGVAGRRWVTYDSECGGLTELKVVHSLNPENSMSYSMAPSKGGHLVIGLSGYFQHIFQKEENAMKTQSMRRILFPCLSAAVLFLAPGLASKPGQPTNGPVFSLQAPPFVGIVNAEEGSVASIIEDEAGIAAYFQASFGINLNDVRDIYRTIELETADYIIGSVPLPNYYDETEDVHVYVHRDGWILAYYLAGDPVGKIYDWIMYRTTGNITTKLENTLAVVAAEAGVPFPGVTYYHFRYPNATHLMLIAEQAYAFSGSNCGYSQYWAADSFSVKLPGTFAYYERSWSLGSTNYAEYVLNGARIYYHGSGLWSSRGTLTTAQLLPDQFHYIAVKACYGYAYGGLALIYREL